MTTGTKPINWMTRKQAATYLTVFCGVPISHKTLAQYASRAYVEGPLYALSNGRAIYERADLDKWAAEKRSLKARTVAQHDKIAKRGAAA